MHLRMGLLWAVQIRVLTRIGDAARKKCDALTIRDDRNRACSRARLALFVAARASVIERGRIVMKSTSAAPQSNPHVQAVRPMPTA